MPEKVLPDDVNQANYDQLAACARRAWEFVGQRGNPDLPLTQIFCARLTSAYGKSRQVCLQVTPYEVQIMMYGASGLPTATIAQHSEHAMTFALLDWCACSHLVRHIPGAFGWHWTTERNPDHA